MARAVQPTFDAAAAATGNGDGDDDGVDDGASGGEGTASPFRTLKRLRGVKWDVPDPGEGGDVSVNSDSDLDLEGLAPCGECLEALRGEWEEEAMKIWNMIDQWIEE